MLAYFESPLMQVYSVLMHSHVVDRLDFQSDCDAAVSGLQKRAG